MTFNDSIVCNSKLATISNTDICIFIDSITDGPMGYGPLCNRSINVLHGLRTRMKKIILNTNIYINKFNILRCRRLSAFGFPENV